ncbi:hypothetical protein N0V83_001631 [Neocucurbitaria cava]|uniref:Xylanolytic transcriptional activator regulatory domain-containing protein n=1 Tax=Neocucurbitaria cava TaxID=798079 RepID=A0A9W8YFL4_9PLEO|nr:hypothetical protein N0V83_001631 [Neocucurbitaria cava]
MPAQPHTAAPTNGNNLSRRNIIPRHQSTERRASDASVLGLSMESRMARIETMMEALIHERGMTMTPMGSIEREENGSDGLRSEAAFAMPLLDPINPALAQMEQQSDMQYESPADWRLPHPFEEARMGSTGAPVTIRLGHRTLPFPPFVEYNKYVNHFFGDTHLRYPCIEESEFRAFGARILATSVVQPDDTYSLTLNYVVFACCDVLMKTLPQAPGGPHGWSWYQIADGLLDKTALLTGTGGLALVQVLLFQALYLKFADIGTSAYTTIGLASRLSLQYGLHQQRSLSHLNPEQLYTHISVFWNVFVADRFISLSCGRPYSIREQDIDVGQPAEVYMKVPLHAKTPVNGHPRHHFNLYMEYMISLATRAGRTWDAAVIGKSASDMLDGHNKTAAVAASSEIARLFITELPGEHVQPGVEPEAYDMSVMILNYNNITLLLRHREMTSLQYDYKCACEFSDLAIDSISELRIFLPGAERLPFTETQRGFVQTIISSTAGVLLVFCALLVRDLSTPELNLQQGYLTYIKGVQDGFELLTALKPHIPYARRVLEEFAPLRYVVENVIEEFPMSSSSHAGAFSVVEALIPPNIVDLFPYRPLTPPLDTGYHYNTELGKNGKGILWLC